MGGGQSVRKGDVRVLWRTDHASHYLLSAPLPVFDCRDSDAKTRALGEMALGDTADLELEVIRAVWVDPDRRLRAAAGCCRGCSWCVLRHLFLPHSCDCRTAFPL